MFWFMNDCIIGYLFVSLSIFYFSYEVETRDPSVIKRLQGS